MGLLLKLLRATFGSARGDLGGGALWLHFDLMFESLCSLSRAILVSFLSLSGHFGVTFGRSSTATSGAETIG